MPESLRTPETVPQKARIVAEIHELTECAYALAAATVDETGEKLDAIIATVRDLVREEDS